MIKIVSFGYKHRAAPPQSAVFDCRELPNPHHVESLRKSDGRDDKVVRFVRHSVLFDHVVDKAMNAAVGAANVLAFGCVGGRHRSVVVAEEVATRLRNMDLHVVVEHLEL